MAKEIFSNLAPISHLITPNLKEAEFFCNLTIKSIDDMKKASLLLANKFKTNVLLTGGHVNDEFCCDLLYLKETKNFTAVKKTKINSSHTHGTGCGLSTAIACFAAQGHSWTECITKSINFIRQAITQAQHFKLGNGVNPIDHGLINNKKYYDQGVSL
jgi:hydroxymethylpyrimidine/phosphomethylpyrimidine kinase